MARPRAITVPGEALPRILGGSPLLPLDVFREASAVGDTGRALELIDSRGGFLGFGIVDAENGFLRILSRDPDDRELDDAFLERRAGDAIDLRMRLGLLPAGAPPDGAFRLVHGEGDGLSGFLIDAYGEFLIQYVLARGLREWGRRLAEAICRGAEARGLKTAAGQPWPRGVLQKVRDKGAAKPGKPVQSTVCGEEPPPKYQVHENGVPFEIHPLAGLNVGLFTDMREHRWRIGRFARGARVLNTFAYTGSLSVAAAMQGAAHVTSVDLSSGVLKWAEENFRLAGLDPARHRFEASDTLRFLEAAARAGERFDLVILDPPTFSAARAASWSMRQDLEALIASAVSLLPRGGILWFSGNSHQLSEQDIDLQIEHGARAAGRELALLETGGLPPDYPTPPALPKARYLKLRILRAP